jgi:elongation factor Ts
VIAKLDGTTSGTLLELNCETDFVAKSAKFGELAQSVVDAAFGTTDARRCESVQVDGKPLSDVLNDANASMGEKIEVRRVATLSRRVRRDLPAPHQPRPAAAARRPGRADR